MVCCPLGWICEGCLVESWSMASSFKGGNHGTWNVRISVEWLRYSPRFLYPQNCCFIRMAVRSVMSELQIADVARMYQVDLRQGAGPVLVSKTRNARDDRCTMSRRLRYGGSTLGMCGRRIAGISVCLIRVAPEIAGP